MHIMFDVGIVGAGVAGSCCAQALGNSGVRVALFDNSHPREKPCGGLIENNVVKELKIPHELLENEVNWLAAERFGFRSRLYYASPFYLVSRRDFDHYLLIEALRNKSVTFFPERVVHISKGKECWMLTTDKGRLARTKALIGADGCPSTVRNLVSVPIPLHFLAAAVGYVFSCSNSFVKETFPQNTIEGFYSHRYVPKGGFLWIFPKRTSINVGVGSIQSRKKLKEALDGFILHHPSGRRFQTLQKKSYAHLVPAVWDASFFETSCCGDTWALLGDAAGHVNPISGAGIYYAMKDGMLCAAAFLDSDLRLYDRYWRQEYGDELRRSAKHVLGFYSNAGLFLWLGHLFENRIRRLLD